jgi:CBS-domain-containing membrane protein
VEGSPFSPELVEESMRHCGEIVTVHARKVETLLKQVVRDAVKRGAFELSAGMTGDELVGLVLMGAKGIKMAHAQSSPKAHEQALKKMIDVLCAGAGKTTITLQKRIAR